MKFLEVWFLKTHQGEKDKWNSWSCHGKMAMIVRSPGRKMGALWSYDTFLTKLQEDLMIILVISQLYFIILSHCFICNFIQSSHILLILLRSSPVATLQSLLSTRGSQSPSKPDTAIPNILTQTFLSFTGALNFRLKQSLLKGRKFAIIHRRNVTQKH